MKKQLSFFLVFSCAVLTVSAQQRIGDASTGSKLPNKDAILELESKNKALLVSRIALSSTTVATPLSVHTAGMIAYNTATINDVVPGIYYNDGTKWLLVGKGETTNIKYDPVTNIISYIDGSGNAVTIDIAGIVRGSQTVTKVVAEVLDGKNTGKYTYYNEKDIDKDGNITGPGTVINVVGDVQNNFQEIVNNTEVKQIFETIVKNTGGNVSYNATTNSFTYVDGTGTTQTINITDMVKGNETVTKLVAEVLDGKNTGKYTYYNEKDIDKDGNITGPGTVINVVGDVQNNFQDIVNNTEVKNIFETIVKNTGGNVSYDATNKNFTYVDGNGVTQTINITDMVKGNETVTKLVAEVLDGKNTGKYTYYNEKDIDKDGNITGPGTVINVVGDVQNNFQEIVNNTEVKNIFETIVKNTGGNVSYNTSTNSFTYVDGTGTTQTINITDMVKGNETVTKVVAEVVNGKNTGKYTYYNEKDIDKDGNITGPGTVINVVGDVQNNFQDIVNNTEVKNIFETIVKNTGGNVSYDATNKNFTYVDGTGTTQTINITDMVKGNETVTKVVAEVVNGKNTGKYTYYNEKDIDKDGNITGPGTVINVVGDVQNNFQDIVNNTEVKNIFETIVKNTGGNVSYDATNKNFTYVDGNGVTQTINITDMVKGNETVTKVVAEVRDGKNTGKYTYYNEKDIDKDGNITGPGTVINVVGDVQNNFQDIVNNTEVKNIFETIVKNTGGNVSYDATNNNFTYVDGNGVTQTINITDMVQNNQKTSSVTGTGLANVTSSTTGKNTNYTVDVTATAVQGVQKTSSVTKGDYTTVATTTPTTNNTDYKVDVDPSTLIGAGLKLNATTKKIDVDVTTIPNATDKTATVANGTNTTVATDLTNPNNPIYKVDVNNATANAAGAVKPGSGLAVAADGTLSVNTATAGGIGKTLSSADGSIVIGGGAGATLVDANVKVADKGITIGKLADAPQANQILVSVTNGVPAWADQATVTTANQKTSAVVDGTNTTVTSAPNATDAKITEYKVNVPTANGTSPGVVKQGNGTVVVGTGGELSINLNGTGTPGDPGAGKNFTSTDLTITGGTGATLTPVTAAIALNAVTTTKIADGAVTATKLSAGAGTAGRVAIADDNGNVSYSTTLPDAVSGKDVKVATGDRIKLGGTPVGAVLKEFTIDVDESNLKLQNIGGSLNAGQVSGGNAGDVFVVGADGKGSWVSKASATSVSNTSNVNVNKLSTTVNGTTGSEVDIIKTNELSLNASNHLVSTVNGVVSTTPLNLGPAIAANDKTATVATGTNTTVTTDATNPNNPIYKVNVGTASGATLGLVKEAATNATVKINNSGELSINLNGTGTPGDPGAGKNLTSTDLDITNGSGATLTTVTANIKNGAVTAAKLSAGAGAAGRVGITDASGAITYGTLPAGSVTGNNLTNGDGSIVIGGTTAGAGATLVNATVSVATGGITDTKIAADAVTTTKIANSAVTAAKLSAGAGAAGRVGIADASGSVTYGTLPAGSVTGNNFTSTDLTITNGTGATLTSVSAVIAPNAVTTTKIADGAVTAGKLSAGAGTSGRVGIADASGAVTYGPLPAGSVTGNNFTSTDLTITNGTGATLTSVSAVIAPNAVTTAKIANGTILDADIAAAAAIAVTKLANGTDGQVLTTNGSVPTWTDPSTLAVNNLYTSNGSLTANRTVDLNAHTLTFNNALSSAGKTTLTYSNANAARISHTTTTGTADIIVDAGGSTLNIFQNPNSASQITANGTSTSLNIGTANTTPMTLTTSNLIRMHISDAGKVGIGTTNMLGTSNANVLLAVNGSIESANSTFADYVFEDYFKGYSELKKDYSFKSLKEVEKFINENKHLPGITSIKALRKNQRGEYIFNMSELSIQMLEKVEELYLHTIEQQKQLDAKDKEIQDLKAQQQKTDERLKRLEAALLKEKN